MKKLVGTFEDLINGTVTRAYMINGALWEVVESLPSIGSAIA